MTHRARYRAGTTLLELLIVLVLISTLASLVAAGTAGNGVRSPLTATHDSLRIAIRSGKSVSLYHERDDGSILMSTSYASGLLIVDTLPASPEEAAHASPAPR